MVQNLRDSGTVITYRYKLALVNDSWVLEYLETGSFFPIADDFEKESCGKFHNAAGVRWRRVSGRNLALY